MLDWMGAVSREGKSFWRGFHERQAGGTAGVVASPVSRQGGRRPSSGTRVALDG